jgi:hypothetical protein
MFKYYSSYVLVFTGFTHALCCGIPLLIGLSSIFSNVLVFKMFAFDFELLESLEIYLFTFSTLLILMLVSMEVYNRKINCSEEECCDEEQCDSTQKKIRFNFIFSSILYLFNGSILASDLFH